MRAKYDGTGGKKIWDDFMLIFKRERGFQLHMLEFKLPNQGVSDRQPVCV